MVSEIKIKKAEELREKFQRAKAAVLADYRGLKVEEMNELRRKLKEGTSELIVVKNTLARHAAKDNQFAVMEKFFVGPTSIAISYQDELAPAKVMSGFAKEQGALTLAAGFLQGKAIDVEALTSLANLPPREVLLAQMMSTMQATLANLQSVLSGVLRQFMYVLEAIRKSKEG